MITRAATGLVLALACSGCDRVFGVDLVEVGTPSDGQLVDGQSVDGQPGDGADPDAMPPDAPGPDAPDAPPPTPIEFGFSPTYVCEGTSTTGTVWLNRIPTAGNLTVTITSEYPTYLAITTPEFTFDVSNWNMPQTVTVFGMAYVPVQVAVTAASPPHAPKADSLSVPGSGEPICN